MSEWKRLASVEFWDAAVARAMRSLLQGLAGNTPYLIDGTRFMSKIVSLENRVDELEEA